jgi:hypothetical protein
VVVVVVVIVVVKKSEGEVIVYVDLIKSSILIYTFEIVHPSS